MIRKILILIALLLTSMKLFSESKFELDIAKINAKEVYYKNSSEIIHFPMPVIATKRQGLSSGKHEIDEIKEMIIYPLINKSINAISSVIIEWYPNQSDSLGLTIIWVNGDYRESTILRSIDGHYTNDSYKILLAKPTP